MAYIDDRSLFVEVARGPGEESPYERLFAAAMSGDGALFTREDAVEAAWVAVDPVLNSHNRSHRYKR